MAGTSLNWIDLGVGTKAHPEVPLLSRAKWGLDYPNYLSAPGALSVSIAVLSHKQGLLSRWQKAEWCGNRIWETRTQQTQLSGGKRLHSTWTPFRWALESALQRHPPPSQIPVQGSKGLQTHLAHRVGFRASCEGMDRSSVFISVGNRALTQQLHN